MPKTSAAKLAWQKEYNKRPERKEAGVELRRARRQAIRDGEVKIGDGKDLAHKKAFDNGGHAKPDNLVVQPASKNRGWRKSSGYKVPNNS